MSMDDEAKIGIEYPPVDSPQEKAYKFKREDIGDAADARDLGKEIVGEPLFRAIHQ